MNNVGLYIHIPFCVKKCNYCDFFSVKADSSIMDEYVAQLRESIIKWSEKIKGRTVDTVYFGGGTPSVLGTEKINKTLQAVIDNFDVAPDAEISIEVNPNSTDLLDFSSLSANGINRVSMGLQSACDDELKILGRLHNSSDAHNTINRLLRGGIKNFSLDVMLGIPLQTFDSLDKTLEFCNKSGAAHISTYMLKIEENTPFFFNKDRLAFADVDLQADLYEFTCKKLAESGFRHYEISNFCKDNLISRHNMKYWTLDDYIGIGPSAHSLLDGKRYYYPRSIPEFAQDKLLFESDGHTPDEYIMLSLRTDDGFSFMKYKELFNLLPSAKFLTEAANLEKLGLLSISDENICLTEKGFLVSNAVILRLLNTGI